MAILIPTTTVTGSGFSAGASNLGTSVPVIKKPILPVQIAGLMPLYECNTDECRVQVNVDCCSENYVFGNIVNGKADINSNYKNDWNTFLVDYSLYGANPSATALWFLQKCDPSNPEAIQEGNKFWVNSILFTTQYYGALFDLGSIAAHKTYTGIYINWGKVLLARGPGRYRVKLVTQFAGQTTCQISDDIILRQFNCNLAESSVKWEIWIRGQIGSASTNGRIFNLCNMNWYDSYRHDGWFGFETKPEYLKVYQELQNGTQKQVRNEAIQKYIFESKLLPKHYHDRLSVYMMMADERKISDYNINNSDYNIKQLLVVPDGPYEPEYLDKDHKRTSPVRVEFKAGQQSIIKTLCCITEGKR